MAFTPQIADPINGSKIISDYKSDLGQSIPVLDVAFVGTLLGEVFGVNSPIYLPTWWNDRDYTPSVYNGLTLDDELPDDGSPMRMGQKTFGAFWLKGGKYQSFNQYTGELEHFRYSDFLMPLATIVDLEREMIVTKTPTNGASGSVKEIFGFDDWNISINGIILPDPERKGVERTVEGQMYAIQRFCEIADSIEVEGQRFANRKISRILLAKPVFKEIQGKPNMIQYSINAVSDEDILLMSV